MVKQRRITLVQAAEPCGLSYRQILRIYERYKEEGDAGLIHGNRGRVSSRKNPHQEKIISRYIERDGLDVDQETLRKWLY